MPILYLVMTKFIITNFQSQNVQSPLIVKQERSLHSTNETTRAYICYRKTISTQTVAERCKIYA